jgi:hypothetical protein
VAQDKEPFLARWSRLKREPQPAEKVDESAAPAVPPVESLTPDSDFTLFMNPKVKDELRRLALKKLFNDPHFNVPDPFEPYSRDWTVGEPISEEFLATLNQARTLLFTEPEKKPAEPQARHVEPQASHVEPQASHAAPQVPADEKTIAEEKQDESRGQDTQGL